MTRALVADTPPAAVTSRGAALAVRPAYQSYLMLHVGFAALPVVAGFDKFFHLLVNWDQYLAPLATQILPVTGHTFMLAVGVIEIVAGLLVAFRPRIADISTVAARNCSRAASCSVPSTVAIVVAAALPPREDPVEKQKTPGESGAPGHGVEIR